MSTPEQPDEIGCSVADIPADQIAHYSAETVAEWLLARNEQHRARLRAACDSLHAAAKARETATQRLRAALARRTAARPA